MNHVFGISPTSPRLGQAACGRVYAGTRSGLQLADRRVTPLTLHVGQCGTHSPRERALAEVDSLDVFVNNAGVAICDDLSSADLIEQRTAYPPLRE